MEHQRPKTDDPANPQLEGVSSCPGLVEGEVVVVLRPDPSVPVQGKILVAPMTDPAWVFIMARSAGMIVERGNLLSHAAIIGRELGIPTIVGVGGATNRLETGMRVRLDASSGTATVL